MDGWMCFLSSPVEYSLTPAPPSQAFPSAFPDCHTQHQEPWGDPAQSCPTGIHWKSCRAVPSPLPRISRDAFVSSALPGQLDFALLVSAGFGRPFCTQPWLLSLLLDILTLGLPGWVRNFPLELKSFQNGQQDTHGSIRLPFWGCPQSFACLHSPPSLSCSGGSLPRAWLMWSQVHNGQLCPFNSGSIVMNHYLNNTRLNNYFRKDVNVTPLFKTAEQIRWLSGIKNCRKEVCW